MSAAEILTQETIVLLQADTSHRSLNKLKKGTAAKPKNLGF
jgi:hypothetical protein